jgi:hypothetical protein
MGYNDFNSKQLDLLFELERYIARDHLNNEGKSCMGCGALDTTRIVHTERPKQLEINQTLLCDQCGSKFYRTFDKEGVHPYFEDLLYKATDYMKEMARGYFGILDLETLGYA